jgi:hypothetical protein
MSDPCDILIYVEDPGAANYVAGLPAALSAAGMEARLLAEPAAAAIAAQVGAACEAPGGRLPREWLEAVRPRLVVVGTSENLDTPAFAFTAAARAMGIPTVGAVDAASNSAYRFRGRSANALEHAPDRLMVPDAWTKQSYAKLGYPADRIAVCGHPHFDTVRAFRAGFDEKGRSALRERLYPAAGNAPVVVFVAEISGGLNEGQYRKSADYTLDGWGASTGRTEIVIEEFLEAAVSLRPRPFLALRLHPKNRMEEFEQYRPRFDLVSQGGSALEMVFAADLVVGMTTMLLLEAALLGRPTASILPREAEKIFLRTIQEGITPCATRREEIRPVLEGALRADPAAILDRAEKAMPSGSIARVLEFLRPLLRRTADAR